MLLGTGWRQRADATSLRLRLIGLVALIFAFSLALGGTVACLNASRSVDAEMRAALAVARQTIEAEAVLLATSVEPRRDLERLVASFRGSRHLRVRFIGLDTDATLQVGPTPSAAPVPRWFVRLIDVPPRTLQLPIAIGQRAFGEIIVETAPYNEVAEIWNEFGDGLLILGLFSLPTMALIYLFVGRALRPLERLATALSRLGEGDYAVRLADRLPPELARLRDRFNCTAAQLAAMAAENRRLNEELVGLQQQERSDLARDLHDDVGPYLFAINVDASNITRHMREGKLAAIAGHAAAISEAVHHLQEQVRRMLGRLRPIGLAEFGLADAIANLVEFWRRRRPEIDYRLDIAPAAQFCGDLIDTTIFRIVQEAMNNAIRHSVPSTIRINICVMQTDGREVVKVSVADNGRGAAAGPVMGYGLLGMSERVKAIGGSLDLASAAGEGFTLTAAIPLRGQAAVPPAWATL